MPYADMNFDTPEVFKDKYKDKNVLIISGGNSTSQILHRKQEVRDKFDCIITVNYAFSEFDDIIDFHLVTEKIAENNWVYKKLNDGKFRTDVPRILNWKGILQYDNRYNIYKTARSNFNGNPDVREYKKDGHEGLLIGSASSQSFGLGSVTFSAMHLSGILGAKSIYLIGADMVFKDNYDHFYKDRVYRDEQHKVKISNRHKIITVECNGKTYETTLYFKETAEYINKMANEYFKDIEINDFSDGLLENFNKLNIDKFLSNGG